MKSRSGIQSSGPPHSYFDDRSDLYLRARPRYPEKLFQYLAGLCAVQDRAWDAACGSGQAAVDLAHHFADVQATDISLNQIANAISRPGVTYSVQLSEATGFTDHVFDMIGVAQALHWFDHDAFWPEMLRVLKPGGIFAAWGYTDIFIQKDIDAAMAQYVLQVVEPYWPGRRQILMAQFRTVDFPFARLAVPAFEMSAVWDLDALFAYISSWSSTRRAMAVLGDGFLEEIYQGLLKAWGSRAQKRKITWDFCLVAGRV